MQKRALSLIIVFCLGALGGVWAQAFLLPAMSSSPAFEDLQFIKDWNARTQIITPVQYITVRENESLELAVQKVQGSTVVIQSASGYNGSGLIYTSDGLIVTLAYLVPQGYSVTVHVGEEVFEAQVIKRDIVNDLALLKIEKNELQTIGFAQEQEVVLGESVFFVGKIIEKGEVVTIVNQGILKTQSANLIRTNILESRTLDGSPLFNIEGSVVGLSTIDFEGKLNAVPVSILQAFLGP